MNDVISLILSMVLIAGGWLLGAIQERQRVVKRARIEMDAATTEETIDAVYRVAGGKI